MKKVMLVGIMMVCGTMTMTMANDMTATNQTVVKIDALEKSVQTLASVEKISEASGWGLQIATALKGCVSALNDGVTMTTDQVYKFSDSRLGKITTAIIVYKVIGKEILRLLIGIPLLIVIIVYSIKFLKRFLSVTLNKEGEKTGMFYDLFSDGEDGQVTSICILGGTLVATFLSVLMLLSWMF